MNVDTKLEAGIQITPERSHVYLFMLGFGALLSLTAGFVFLWHKPELCWIPFAFVGVFLASGWSVWSRSHANIDMAGATPTTISNSLTGVSVSTDTRALASPESVQSLEKIFSVLGHREPLPAPDGLLDSSGNPIPGTECAAAQKIDEINATVAERIVQAARLFSGGSRNGLVEHQPFVDPATE